MLCFMTFQNKDIRILSFFCHFSITFGVYQIVMFVLLMFYTHTPCLTVFSVLLCVCVCVCVCVFLCNLTNSAIFCTVKITKKKYNAFLKRHIFNAKSAGLQIVRFISPFDGLSLVRIRYIHA